MSVAKFLLSLFALNTILISGLSYGQNSSSADAQLPNNLSQKSQAPKKVTVYLARPIESDRKNTYIESLLIAAITSLGFKGEIGYADIPYNQQRAEKLLKEGRDIDLAWFAATTNRAKELEYIPIPLYQGLHGNRILLIKNGSQSKFSNVEALTDLTGFMGLARASWTDYDILVKNGLQVDGSMGYRAMVKALGLGLADYFPRSALTVFREASSNQGHDIAIESNLVLQYPIYHLLFLGRKSPETNLLLQRGFNNLYQSGEYQNLFMRYYNQRINTLDLSKRRILKLDNPELPQHEVAAMKLKLLPLSSLTPVTR